MSSDASLAHTGLYENVRPPRYPISSTSQGSYAFIAAVLLTAIAGLVVLVKLQITATTYRKMRQDDYAIIGALAFGVAYTISICQSVNHGLGRAAASLTDAQVQTLSEYYLAANALLWLSLTCSKCGVALLVVSIQPARWMKISLYTICGISTGLGIAALCVTVVQCGPTRWVMGPTAEDTCIDQYAAQIGLRIVDILTDIALAVLPAVMILGVQVPGPKKAAVAFIFGLRILTPVFAALALSSQSQFYDKPTPDRPYAAVAPSVWSSIAMGVSLITTCLPSIKRFLMDWAAGVSNNMMGDTSEYEHTTFSRRAPQASGLRSFTRSRMNNTSKSGAPDGTTYSSYAHGGAQDREGVADDGDSKKGLTEGIVQTTDVSVRYEEEQRHAHRGSPDSEFRFRS